MAKCRHMGFRRCWYELNYPPHCITVNEGLAGVVGCAVGYPTPVGEEINNITSSFQRPIILGSLGQGEGKIPVLKPLVK